MSSIHGHAILTLAMIKLKLKDCLDANNLSVYRLEKECPEVSRTTLYKLASGDVDGIRFNTLNVLLVALERLTGKPVTPNDLLEVIEEPAQLEPEAETRVWMDNSASDMAARLADIEKDVPPEQQAAWLEANHKAAKPVKYVAGRGFVEATR
jgi:DNA-binding Xre family transcriptional regulator